MASAQDFKTLGNQAFSAGKFQEAVELFTKGIEADPSNHVLFSNRSAAYCSMKQYTKALEDANKTIEIKADWPKGYSRKGAALQGLLQFSEAVEAYKKGLDIDPSNALLKKGLEEAETAATSSASDMNPMAALANMFGPDMWVKISANPKTAPYLAQPDYVAKLQEIQGNPSLMNKHMNDPRIMTTIMALMGINADVATSAEEAAKAMEKDEPMQDAPKECPIKKEPTPQQKQQEPEPELTDEEKVKKQKRDSSDAEKALGNAAYKKKDFETALKHYGKAFELDDSNVAVLTNKAAVLFEMENFEECIKVCEEAVELGRSIFADYKLIARALGRAGSSFVKLNQLDNAIKYFEKSLAEHRTPDILSKLRDTEKLKREADKEAYRDPALSDKAREEGNTLFKEQKYADAVKSYSEAIKRNDQDARNFTNRAACYVKLMALAEADKDCDEAMRLDPKFAKGYVRKASVELAKRDFMKAMDWLKEAKERDVDGKSSAEIDQLNMKCYQGLNEVQSGTNREETLKRAQSNPEVQKIMADPVMQSILKQMQENPAAAQEHLKNPGVAAKINTLINAGVISIR